MSTTVPDNLEFSLKDVTSAVYNDTDVGRNLPDCFVDAHPYDFDLGYVGDKDRQSNFRNYGETLLSISENDFSWAYNSVTTQYFMVSTNKTRWAFTEVDDENFTVEVYDTDNEFPVMTGIYTDGMYVHITPNGHNMSGTNYNGHVSVGDGTYLFYGCTCSFTQKYLGADDPPVVFIGCDDYTMTLTGISHVLDIASTSLYLMFTPDNLGTGQPKTIYVTVTKSGPVTLCYDTVVLCSDGVAKTKWVTISEAAVAGRYYYVNLSTSNA